MYTGRETDTTGRKWVPAPTGTMPSGGTSAVMGVWLNDGERVDWRATLRMDIMPADTP
jgi:hypothetical protein